MISTDKTQLTDFRNKSAYPLYLTIGNIPKEIRRKPSTWAYILLAYLPTTKLEHVTNKAQRRRLLGNLYHACMGKILKPLETAGRDGIFMTSGDGKTRRNHPILASFIGDYPEQVLTTGVMTGECPACPVDRNSLGEPETLGLRNLDLILEALDTFDTDPASFLQTCSNIGIKPIVDPFWKNLPYTHIYRSITPDILHQLYQGVIKHLIGWVTEACGAEEIDARCRRMPPSHNVRSFMKGITSLSRVTGQEHDQMCRILLGLVIDAPLGYEHNISNGRQLVCAVRALLDFLYLAQYPIHTDTTLKLLDDALRRFHDNKEIFVELGLRNGFNLPKLHFISHYLTLIKLYGTTDNTNTEYTERLHIDLAKDAYAATNRKDEFTQMTTWLERKEKILRHHQFIKWRLDGSLIPQKVQEWLPPGLELDRTLSMAKHPTIHAVPISQLEHQYGATYFSVALRRYIALKIDPNMGAAQLERKLFDIRLPFSTVPVWHKIKYLREDPYTHVSATVDAVHVHPARKDIRGQTVPGRFDTVLVNKGTGCETGIYGETFLLLFLSSSHASMTGYRVAHIRVIFLIPPKLIPIIFQNTNTIIPNHLAYVEWYSAFKDYPENESLLYKITPLKDSNDGRICSVVPVANIRRSVHLLPKFGPVAPQEWTSSNVLDLCNVFFVNCFTDRHLYRILY